MISHYCVCLCVCAQTTPPLRKVVELYGRVPQKVFDDDKLPYLLNMFKKVGSHFAIVRTVNNEGLSFAYSTNFRFLFFFSFLLLRSCSLIQLKYVLDCFFLIKVPVIHSTRQLELSHWKMFWKKSFKTKFSTKQTSLVPFSSHNTTQSQSQSHTMLTVTSNIFICTLSCGFHSLKTIFETRKQTPTEIYSFALVQSICQKTGD
jgi:hypothetical protein